MVDNKVLDQKSGENWAMYHGDCVEVMKGIPENSIDFCVHSPPFAQLYIYSDSEADMGNCSDNEEFFQHYRYAIDELFRVTVKGRLCAVHCKDLPKYANVWGTTGLIDFPGACIQEFEDAGWVFHSRITIWKCPVIERERTNNNGLLHKTVKRDTSQVRQGMADYLLIFRKPPEPGTLLSDKPIVRPRGFDRYIGECDPRQGIKPKQEGYHETENDNQQHPSRFSRKPSTDGSIAIWQRYADPVWWDINQTNVLNFKQSKRASDRVHICPLQLDVIERAIHIWSDTGETVLSPFAGIGSEGVGALKLGRKFVGVELRKDWFEDACGYLSAIEAETKVPELALEFD